MNDRKLAGISLCMIVKNEERFLADALRSAAAAVDEICIVDTGSSDATVAIAEEFGARIVHVPWTDDFSAARNAALALATRRWILVLDADERLHPDSTQALQAIGREPAQLRGKWLQCRNLSDDFKGSGAMSNALVRIFPSDARIRYRNPIHEFVALDGAQAGLPADMTGIEIVHLGYLNDVVRDRGKAERNLRLSRSAALLEPHDPFHQYNLGMAELLAGNHAAAIVALEEMRARTLNTPRGFRAHGLVALADLYNDVRADTDRALAVIAECLNVAPNYSSAHFTHGRILARAGRYFEARNAFGAAIGAGAHDAEQFVVDGEVAVWKAHSEIGATLMREDRHAEALQWFELASQARPSAQPLIVNRARAHEALGDLAAAEALYRAAADGFADESSAIGFVNFLLRSGNEDAAIAAIESSLERLSTGYQRVFLGTAAACRLRAGDEPDAAAFVARALAVGDPSESEATLRALFAQIGQPQLLRFLRIEPARAAGLRIAYTPLR
ncbi:MAG: hypothetical protein NVSMB64_06740 [Candidatus Velthaea sp.]